MTDNLPANTNGDDNQSIWDATKFPSKTKPITSTPDDVKNCLEEYANSVKPLSECLRMFNIAPLTFYALVGRYPEICNEYRSAQVAKVAAYSNQAMRDWAELPDDDRLYQHDREGHKYLSNAGQKWVKDRADFMIRMAAAHETGSYVPASKQDVRSINMSINADAAQVLPSGVDFSKLGPDGVVEALRKLQSPGTQDV